MLSQRVPESRFASRIWHRRGPRVGSVRIYPATDQRHREIGRARAIVALITGQHDKTVGPMRSVEQE
jgi:hypothetical protein